MIQRLKQALTGIVLMASMYFGSPANAEEEQEVPIDQDGIEAVEDKKKSPVKGSVELMGGHEGTSLDAKVAVDLGKGFGLFTRQYANLDYSFVDEEVDEQAEALAEEGEGPGSPYSHFGLVDVTYELREGCDVFTEFRYSISAPDNPKKPEIAVSPRVGIQGHGGVGNLNVYGNATLDVLNRDSDARVEFLGTASYKIELSDDFYLIPSLEGIVNIADDGNVIAIQRPRLELGDDHFQAGLAVNIGESYNQEANSVDVDVNVGGSVQLIF